LSARYHIFVIEKDAMLRRLLKRRIEQNGYLASFAENEEEALPLLYNQRPDLLLFDSALPGADGSDFIRDLHSWAQFPILVLSEITTTADKVAVLDAGASDYIVKPFDLEELMARIRVALRLIVPALVLNLRL
jgi:two-component system KDP operon response regulator KdpE